MANWGGRPTAPLVLEPEEREYLERQVRRRGLARSMSERCRIILRCADGIQSKVVAAELGVHEHTVGKWRRRFLKDRIEGLRCDPLVDSFDGGSDGLFAHDNPTHLDGLRTTAASLRDVQAVERSAVRRQGARIVGLYLSPP